MENKTNWIVLVVIAAVVIVGGWWLLRAHPAPSTNEPIKIGFIGPLTGDAAIYGQPFQQTVALAVEQINAAGGINGRQVQVIYEDDKCNGQDAASATQRLVNVDKVQAIIGSVCSGATIPAARIAEQGKVVLFSPGSSSPALTGISRYFFRDYPSDSKQGEVLTQVAITNGWKKAAVLQEQTDYGAGLYKSFNDSFSASGTVLTESFPSSASDFRSVLTKLKSENPDVLFLAAQTPASGDRILKQMQALGWKPHLIISDTIAGDPVTVSNDSSLLEGAIAAEFVPNENNPVYAKFISDYVAKYGSKPPYENYMVCVYDAVNLLAQGIKQVGYDGSKLADWSRTIKDYQGASGSVTIGADGDRASGHIPEVIHSGEKQPLAQ